ncbi:MAG TPA: hypothetical protein EYP43_04145 [Thermoplasmata archaeon]|nr:hypothetical protein [Thermoplasmata archaeon]
MRYLSIEGDIEINRLELADEGKPDLPLLTWTPGQVSAMRFAGCPFYGIFDTGWPMYHSERATPVHRRNHRPSLYAAEWFLISRVVPDQNGHVFIETDETRLAIQKWRFDHEEEHDLIQTLFSATGLEDEGARGREMRAIMASE